MVCPVCKSDHFYIKDPDDEYEIHEFEVRQGKLHFQDAQAGDDASRMAETQEIFCNRCSWHGPLERAH